MLLPIIRHPVIAVVGACLSAGIKDVADVVKDASFTPRFCIEL
jgi:hypothetical protein